MANVRIGPDGSIIKDDEVVAPGGRSVIREDGTIETANISSHSAPAAPIHSVNTPPVSPLERNRSEHGSAPSLSLPDSQQSAAVNLKAIREKEYDIQMLEGKISNSAPKGLIIATIVFCILGAFVPEIFFPCAVVSGILIVVNLSKVGSMNAERTKLYEELETLKRGGQQ